MQLIRKLFGRGNQAVPEPRPEPELPPNGLHSRFSVGWATDIGSTRRHNEDTVLVVTSCQDGHHARSALGLFVVADGMGGHRAGEIASSIAARTVAERIMPGCFLHALETDDRKGDVATLLTDSVHAANEAVLKDVPGAGTTLTCALLVGSQVYLAHVGDSRAYIFTEAGLDQVTQDHSLVDRLVRSGEVTPEEAHGHPQKNVLYRAVGQNGDLEIASYARELPDGGSLLLCSDGLWGAVSEAEIGHIMTSSASPQLSCESLIAAANRAGGPDNITAIIVHLSASQPS